MRIINAVLCLDYEEFKGRLEKVTDYICDVADHELAECGGMPKDPTNVRSWFDAGWQIDRLGAAVAGPSAKYATLLSIIKVARFPEKKP